MVDDDRLARLTPAQRRLYDKRVADARREQDRGTIARRPGSGPHPLSFPQERFWFLAQLEPGSTEYNVSGAARLTGRLDRAALARALSDIVARHAALRTTFPAPDGVPGQHVAAHVPLDLPIDDLRDVDPGSRAADFAARARTFAREPFDLARGPLFRVRLVATAEDEHVLLFGLHHAISDGWSVAILVRELAELYRAHARGRPVALPPLPIEYADYAAWQRERMSGAEIERLLAHWRATLDGAPSSSALPTDRSRRTLSSHAGRTLRWDLDADLSDAVRALAAREKATPFALMLASFQGFLARITGEEDVVVGSSVANRDRRELAGVVGAFVDTVVLRTSCAGDPTFRELVARAQAVVRTAAAHAALPFEKLVAELAPARDPSRTPFFDVFFDMGVPRPKPDWGDLAYDEFEIESGNALFDLGLMIEDGAGRLRAAFEYSTELFDPPTIERLRRLYAHFLRAAVAAPETRLSLLPALDDAERALVVDRFNATSLAYDRAESAHRSFARRAASDPDAIALEDGDARITYAELDARANRMGHALVRLGAGPETRVAVCLPRSIDAIVALYGVWKSGAAYVPLDVEDPTARWIERLDDVEALALVARPDVAARVVGAGWRGTVVDPSESTSGPDSSTDSSVSSPPDALAYVLFTSGSTGKPKGVMIEHGALANHLAWVRTAFDLRPSDRFLLRTPMTFDASLWEIVHPLACGATLVVAPQETGRDPALLLDLCARSRISVLQTVPSLLRVWLEEPRFAECGALRHLICAGEALDRDLVGRFDATTRALGLRIALHNLYGPSEACIDATWHTLELDAAASDADRGAVPIGKPISNARAYVLDQRGEPAPIGAVGELYLGGDGLGRGYWHDPELTALRFVPNPFGPGRLYRTGDRARWLADGTLAFVGRSDRQLKLNGVRVEPGEIEEDLRAHPDVRDAAVVASRDGPHDRRLQAFVAAVEGRTIDVRGLRAFLGQRLPRNLVPAAIVVLDALPLTASLKVDLRALETLAARDAVRTEPEPPRTPTERRVADLARALLGAVDVGRDDDFFALGGHSLLAAQLVARAREAWSVELPLARFFEEPTVAGLARAIDTAVASGAARADPTIPRGDGAARALSFAQEGLWIAQQLDPASALYVVSGGLRLCGDLDADALERALARVVGRHDALRTTFDDLGDGPRARVTVREIALVRRDLSAVTGGAETALHAFLAESSRKPFDLRRGPLVRAALLRLGPREQVLALDVHHAVADGWSLELLVGELARAYAADVGATGDDPPPLPIQYADWAEWQRAQACGARFAEQLAHWRKTLAGAPPRTRLPVDRPDPPASTRAGASIAFTLEREVADAARAYARERRTPLYPVLAAAFAATLRRVGADEDIVVGTVVGSRPRAELEALIGPFVNVVPLRIDLSGAPDFDELVRRVAPVATTAWENGDVPFERIAREHARTPGREPLVDVACDLESFPGSRARFPGLATELVRVDPGTTKVDLSLTFEDDGETLSGYLQHSTEIFAPATAAGFLDRFRALLAAALESPTTSIETLALGDATAVAGSGAIVVDPEGRALPAGVVGELCERVGTELVATGELARITADGRVVAHGRVGEDVRIGARRVRPSAVEAALAEHSGVRASVVEARARDDGDLELVAHVATGIGPAELHAHLARRLPAASIPTLWRVVDRLPTTARGELDRGAAARVPPAELAPIEPSRHVAPRDELEAALHDLFASALEREKIGILDDFFALGGGSLAAIRLVTRLRSAFEADVALADFYASASIAGVARAIRTIRAGGPRAEAVVDLERDARLDERFPARVTATWNGPPRRWLLTGATGYLGAFLLRGLLDGGAESVQCLVRAKDDAQGLERLAANLRRYELSTEGLGERARALPGDLGEHDLGLDAATRARLADEVDGVLHSGAAVHFLADYARLRPANVDGTRALLELAAQRGLPFHHVSTIGVYARVDDRSRIQREDDPLPDPARLEWGYERTKWVAERLVAEARARGLGVTIHRPGRISGSSRSGAWNLDDFAARMMRGVVAIGAAPDLDVEIDVTPVDWVADAIVHLCTQRPRGTAYHLANPAPTRFLAFFERLRARGFDVRVVPFARWLAEVRVAVDGDADHPLAPLLEMLGAQREDVEPARLVPDLELPRLDSSNTLRDVVGAGIRCPIVDDALRDRWIDGFVRSGAIRPASGAGSVASGARGSG